MLAGVEAFVEAGVAGGNKPAFFHHLARSRIIYEMTANERCDGCGGANVVNHHAERFGANALVPKGLAHPVAHGGLAGQCRELALARRSVAYGAHQFARLAQHDSPGAGVVKHGANDLPAFLHRLMRLPAGSRSHIGVTCQGKQCFGICIGEKAQQ